MQCKCLTHLFIMFYYEPSLLLKLGGSWFKLSHLQQLPGQRQPTMAQMAKYWTEGQAKNIIACTIFVCRPI